MSTDMTPATILTFMNEQLQRTETDIDAAIRSVLNELNRHELLQAEEPGTISQGDSSLDKPDDYKSYISLQLTANGTISDPLRPMGGGMKGMEEARANINGGLGTGPPWFYASYEDKIQILSAADKDYTYTFKYYRTHPRDVGTILYSDLWENVFNFGVTYYTAVKFGITSKVALWQPIYLAERELQILSTPRHIRIAGG